MCTATSRTLAATVSVNPSTLETTGTVVPHAQMSLTHPYVFWATSKCTASLSTGAGLVTAFSVAGTGGAVVLGTVVAVGYVLTVVFLGMMISCSGLLENEISDGVGLLNTVDNKSLYPSSIVVSS